MSKKKIYTMWERVKATPEREIDIARRKAINDTLNSEIFKKACNKANTPITRRQARKFNNKKGIAFKNKE
jgi:hypothetical protein